MELDQRAAAMEAFKKDLDEREKLLTQRFENESVNKQVIESFENIDPEQAAPLLMALFKEDETLTALLLRRMAAKKAGKILEAMIPLDPELSTRLSQKILTFYSDRKNQAPKPR
jgi:flagellar motility protein MotE (MotC chaperone)